MAARREEKSISGKEAKENTLDKLLAASSTSRPYSSYEPKSGLRSAHSVVSISRASYVSAMSRVPELAPFQLMNIANSIYSIRQKLCD